MKRTSTFDTVGLNTLYATSFGAYWMIYAIAGSFASVFMLAAVVIMSIGKVKSHR